MDLTYLREKSHRFVIGLMSGTSCDGIDAVLIRVKDTGLNLAIKYFHHMHFPFSQSLRTKLLNEHLSAQEVCQLNFEVGERFAEASLEMMQWAESKQIVVDFISSHGQTVAHYPPPHNLHIGTLQIGEPAIIAERTGLLVVSDFRPRDMAVGGQGAPLVPYADWLLFRKLNRTVVCLNIGGIANFTVVTPKFEKILAFDTGPGNMAIDGAVRLLSRGSVDMDEDGQLARKGKVIDEFLDYLLDHPYFAKVPPKSTGREEFGTDVYLRDAIASRKEHGHENLIATITRAVAQSIVQSYNRFVKPDYDVDHIIIGGGGAMNKTLIRLIREGIPELKIYTSDQYGIPYAAREAIAFAILGNETVCGTPNNVPQATGAQKPVVMGKITPA